MPAHAILGAQWGDEGKGKLVDVLAQGYDFVVRFQGGNNAGHTVVVGDEVYKFNLLPSGAVRGRRVVIGSGVVVDPRVLVEEVDRLQARGRPVKLVLSDRAHVIMPYHLLLDEAAEAGGAGGRKIGTTKRGIGPCYADKAARRGIRVLDFVNPVRFKDRLAEVYPAKEREMRAWGIDPPTIESIVAEFSPLADRLRSHVADAGGLLDGALQRGRRVLLEGAQGLLLDVDHGTYPYVTSSSTVATGPGAGIGSNHVQAVLGVAKAYATRVGEGPFPTEISAAEGVGKRILEVGKEFGTVTGRKRRIGWLDVPALRYAVRIGGITHLAITKLDVLDGLEEFQVAVAYEVAGQRLPTFPAGEDVLASVKPVYRTFKGWRAAAETTRGPRRLTAPAKGYLRFLERATGRPVVLASVGPGREATVTLRPHPFGARSGHAGGAARRAGPRRTGPG